MFYNIAYVHCMFSDTDKDWNVKFEEAARPGMCDVPEVTMDSTESILDRKYIVQHTCLESLIRHAVGETCSGCEAITTFSFREQGTCLIAKWQCSDHPFSRSHSNGMWATQPRCAGGFAVNVLGPAATLLSGNNAGKIERYMEVLNISFYSRRHHDR